MARRTSIKPLQEFGEINMTPLIDLTFLLLITFIITMPLIEQGIPINLPKGKARDLDQPESRSITMSESGEVFLDNVSISLDRLGSEMRAASSAKPDTTVLVRADEKLAYGKVVEVMRVLQESQITRMALVTTPDARPTR